MKPLYNVRTFHCAIRPECPNMAAGSAIDTIVVARFLALEPQGRYVPVTRHKGATFRHRWG